MAHKFLNSSDVVTGFKKVGGKGVSQGVAANGFVDVGGFGSGPDSFLQAGFIHMMAALKAGARVTGEF